MSHLKSIPLFSGVSDIEMRMIETLSSTRTYPKNTLLIKEGDEATAMYVVLSGKLRAYVSDEGGRQFTLNTMGSDEYFGELALLQDEICRASVVTVEKSTVLILQKEQLNTILAVRPSIAQSFLKSMGNRVRQLTENVKTLAFEDVYGRIRKTLLSLVVEQRGEILLVDRLTQQDIANRVGSSREMVARILKELSAGGYIHTDGKHFKLLKRLPESY